MTLGALRDVVVALGLVPGRKSLVVVSEGIVDDPEMRELDQIVDAARAANAALYFLDVRGVVGPGYAAAEKEPPPRTMQTWTLLRQGAGVGTERLADETGGRTLSSNDLAAGLLRVSAEAHAYYLLGYAPAEPRRPGSRKVTVRVRRPGLTVRSRKSWRVPSPVEARPAGTGAEAAATTMREPATVDTPAVALQETSPSAPDARPLDLLARSGADLADVPLALSAYVFDGAVARSAEPTRIQPAEDGRVIRLFGFPLRGLAPGVYSITVDVRDVTADATATATDTFRILAIGR